MKISKLTDYLLSLAPDHFGTGIEPATEAELIRLEAASGRPVEGYHRDFLLAMGNTKAGVLDPFLNGRVFNIEELVRAHTVLKRDGLTLAPEISIFSSPEFYSDFEFIRTDSKLAQKQEIGTFNFDTGEFFPEEIRTLEDYLLEFAFTFRVGQLEHVYTFVPEKQQGPQLCKKVLGRNGLVSLFQLSDQSNCYEGGSWAAVVCKDGSGHIASDDRIELLRLCGELEDLADMKILPRPRLEAPKR